MIIQGRLKARTWETREGEKRTSFEVDVEEIGPSLKWATAKVTRAQRSGGGGGYGGGAPQSGGQSGGQADPWATSGPQGGGGQGGPSGAPQNDPWAAPGAGNDEPPF